MVPIWGNFGRWLRETLNPLNPMCQHDNQHCGNTWIKLASSVGTKGEGLWRFLEERWKMTPRGLWGLGSSWLVYGAIVSSPLWHDSHWQLNHLPDFKLPNFSAGSQKRKTRTESFHHPPSAIHYPQIIEKKKKAGEREHSQPHPVLSFQGSAGPKTLSFSRGPTSGPLSLCQLPTSARERIQRGETLKPEETRSNIRIWPTVRWLRTIPLLPLA